ncbi:MAG: ribonuclease Y [Candidatus Dadabacteria bacterium]|nr:ribonuclease Y [Candidatus Dadabacteria bacterium]NIQ16783.1 ribonuclease Y [Candidatus Dadabacteria bacterium]
MITTYIIPIITFIAGFGIYFAYRMMQDNKEAGISQSKAKVILSDANKEAEQIKIKAELKAKDITEKKTSEMDRMINDKQRDLSKIEKRLQSKEDNLDKKFQTNERKENELKRLENENIQKEEVLAKKQVELDETIEIAKRKIEEIAGMSRESAKNELINIVEDEAKHEAAKRLKLIEEELNRTAEEKSKNIIALAIQRYAGQYTSEKTISVVNLPSDDMKGRIIGREGRNIRSIEHRTGVDLIIDDTPETVVISSLNPIRREIARISVERLIADGRIHPTRIEEIVEEVESEIQKEIQKSGEDALFDLGLGSMHPDLVKHVGMLKYRTSYSQNILNHSVEVGFICGILASEIGFDIKLARRAGLLHDIGKAVDHEVEGSHVDIGAELVKKYGENEEIVDALEKAHDPQPQGVLPLLVQAADAISAARPGARRETYEAYVKRIEDIENIASSFSGVEKCYAIQAGREVRVLVENTNVSDEEASMLSHEIAKRIEKEVAYPGQVKITVIRESRSVAYAS